MSDLLHQNLDVAQSNKQPDPATIASAATIAPTNRFSFISGNTEVSTITPPTTGYCEVTLCFTHAAPPVFGVGGNILTAYQPIQNRPITLCYNKPSNKWYVAAVV